MGALIGPLAAYENMTPYQNLKMIARFYPEVSRNTVNEVLQLTGLSNHMYEKISTFSMGMKQRFGIASALLSKPRLVILDEATNQSLEEVYVKKVEAAAYEYNTRK